MRNNRRNNRRNFLATHPAIISIGMKSLYRLRNLLSFDFTKTKIKAAARCALDGGGARLSRCGRLRK